MEIRTYDPGDWPALRALVCQHWPAGHPYADRILFEWQFMGFAADGPVSKVIEDKGQIAGFLGGTPGRYWANRQVLPGVVFDRWVLRPDLREAGPLMLEALEDEFEVCCCLGVDQDVVQHCTARGYSCSPSFRRWIVPLQLGSFRKLTAAAPGGAGAGEVAPPDLANVPLAEAWRNPDPLALQIVYERTVEQAFQLALHRNAEFWAWRYFRSAGLKYQIFGSVVDLGIVVARIESTVSPGRPELDGMKVLHLVELLPTRAETWHGQVDDAHLSLVRGVLAWAARKGCVLADVQHSSGRLDHLLAAAGFTERTPSAPPPPIRAVPNVFQPLRFDTLPTQYAWRLTGSAATPRPMEPEDIYFVPFDGGMNRPGLGPVAAGHA